jgi:DNA-binding NtrC family response regulator
LRVIQEGEFERVGGSKTIRSEVRLVAATNKDLLQAVAAGKFREDLYYRLNVVPIALPPLRDRAEDVPALAEHFVRKYAQRFRRPMRSIAPDAMAILQRYPWPGNIRELENLIERTVAIGDGEQLELSDIPMDFQMEALPSSGAEGSLLDEACETFERNFIKRALQKCNNHRADTAKYLGIPLSTLKYKLGRLNLTERQPV